VKRERRMIRAASVLPVLPAMVAAAMSCAGSGDALPPHELSMRFTHPELYEGRDDFARQNALAEMLGRKILRRGMSADDVRYLLGTPDRCWVRGEEDEAGDGFRIGEPFVWQYERLKSVLRIEFDRADLLLSRSVARRDKISECRQILRASAAHQAARRRRPHVAADAGEGPPPPQKESQRGIHVLRGLRARARAESAERFLWHHDEGGPPTGIW
jgi:hypothetical protein